MRAEQTEIYFADFQDPPTIHYQVPSFALPDGHLIIKVFEQTDEQAGGRGQDRRVMMDQMEGTTFILNGAPAGQYKNTRDCKDAPPGYARWTILIKSHDSEPEVFEGDWTHEAMVDYK